MRETRRRATELVVACVVLLTVGWSTPAHAAEDVPAPESALDRAKALTAAGQHAEGEAAAREALLEAEADAGSESLAAAQALDALVAALLYRGQAAEPATRAAAERALAINEKALGPDHPHVASSLNNLARVLEAAGDLSGARPLFERALAIRGKALGPDHPDVASSLNDLASLLQDAGDLSGARPLLERALVIEEKALGPDHVEVATSLSNLALLLLDAGDLSGARPLFERALAINEKALGPDHSDVAWSLNNLASLLRDAGDLRGARPLRVRSLAILEKALGPDHPDVAASLNNLALLLQDAGDLSGARPLLDRALAIWENALGPDHPDVASSLNSLACLLHDAGDLSGARPLHERALAIREKALGPDHPHVAMSLNNLATLLHASGDLSGARPLFERAIAIEEKALGPDHPEVASSWNNLASLLQASGDVSGARPLFERALSIWEKALGPDHPHVAASLNNLARLLQTSGDLSGARPLFDRALAIREKALGLDHPDVAASLNNLAVLLRDAGDLSGALPLFDRALAIREKALGPDHPSVAQSLNNLATLHAATGRPADAFAHALRAEDIGRRHLRLTAATLSQREALRYAATREDGRDVLLSLCAAHSDPSRDAPALDQLVRSRGITLHLMAERRRAGALDPSLLPLAHARTVAASRLAKLVARGLGRDTPERYRQLLESARHDMEEAERELGRRSAKFRAQQARADVGLDAVAAALPPGTTLVAYARFTQVPVLHPGHEKPTPEEAAYLAFVLRGGEAQPLVVPLGLAEPLERAVARWRNAATSDAADPDSMRSASLALRRLAWDPIAPRVVDARRVIVVPDGALLSVPLATLADDEGGFLVESGPTIAYLAAERDLAATDAAPTAAPGGLLALGGADFDATAHPVLVARVAAAAVANLSSFQRSDPSDCPTFDTLRFDPLPATPAEAQDVTRSWRRHARRADHSRETTTLLGPLATEAAFKRQLGRHRVLHIATHGFFLGAECAPGTSASRGVVPSSESSNHDAPLPALALESPLLRSGLALAGFNRRDEAKEGEEDGVLTAEEVASLDLSGVEWAVLSACETGLGDVQSGEGVLGLQRAFKIAGAGSVIMSLWKVPDAETRQFMRELYDAHLVRGLDSAESVRAASLAVLRERRARGESDSPYWWGAFVASGDQ